ncbi:MAG: hypothetical protein WCD20_02275 [Rhodomicrobium sp.]
MNIIPIGFGSSAGIAKGVPAAPARKGPRGPVPALYLGLVSALLVFGCPASAGAAFECPEIGKGAVPALISPVEAKILAEGGEPDQANEVNELIVRLKAERRGISFDEITNELMAAYCPIVAGTSLSTEAKSDRLNTFGALVRKSLASETLAPGSSIVAMVPLTLDAYRALLAKAGQAGKTPSEYMSAILTKAAAEPGK